MLLLAGGRIIYVDQSLKEDWMLFLAGLLGTVAVVLSFACTSRQNNPIQRNTFVDIYSIVCVSDFLIGIYSLLKLKPSEPESIQSSKWTIFVFESWMKLKPSETDTFKATNAWFSDWNLMSNNGALGEAVAYVMSGIYSNMF